MGKVGVIEKDAIAGFLGYNANPIEDTNIVENFENSLLFIMNDAEILNGILN